MSERTRLVGKHEVGPVGIGCARLSLLDAPERPQALRTLHAAFDAGVQVVDSAAAYIPDLASQGHNELLIAEAIRTWSGDPETILVATKGGHVRAAEGLTRESFLVDGRPEFIRANCDASLQALGVERIGLYFLHWPDPDIPIAESMGALEDLRREGKVELVGLSNVSVEQIEEARAVGSVDAVQNRFSVFARESLAVLQHCDAREIAFLAYSPNSGVTQTPEAPTALHEIAATRGVSPQRVALAWLLDQASVTIPLVGTRRPETIVDSAAAAELILTPDELSALDALAP